MEDIYDLNHYKKMNIFNKGQLWEIQQGIEAGVDVSVYAKVEYSWRQMQEIFLGLFKNIDVSLYADPKFSMQQMKEIRLGLIDNINVKEYLNENLGANEMPEIRAKLIAEKDNKNIVLSEEDIKVFKEIQQNLLKKWNNNKKDETDFINEYVFNSLIKNNIENYTNDKSNIKTLYKKIKNIKFNVWQLCSIYQAVINNKSVIAYLESLNNYTKEIYENKKK